MKALLLTTAFVFISVFSNAQAKLSMSKYRKFLPADSVLYSTNVQLQVYIKNTGTAAFLGNIDLYAKRDTMGTVGIALDTLNFTSVNINMGDSIPAILQFTPTTIPSGTFKINGNGNVIVVWPISSSALLGDSVRSTLFIYGGVGLNEIEANNITIYPNPASSKVFITLNGNQIPKKYQIYDVFGRNVKEVEWLDTVDVSELNNGLYWLILFTENKSYKTKIIKQ